MSDVCIEQALPDGPVAAATQPGDLGAARRVCPRTEAALSGGALLVADTAHFYGHIVAGGHLAGSVALDDLTEVFLDAELVRMDNILGAIPASSIGPGHLSLGATRGLVDGDGLRGALHARLVLPTAIGVYHNAAPLGLDVGFGVSKALSDKVRLHGDLDLLGQAWVGSGALRGGVGVLAGAEWRVGKAFGLVGDVHGGFGFASAIDDVSIAPGFRFAGGDHLGIELSAMVPLVGRDRAPLAAAALRLSWRL